MKLHLDTFLRTHFLLQGLLILAQVVQGGCGISIPGVSQSPTGHNPGQPVIADPA